MPDENENLEQVGNEPQLDAEQMMGDGGGEATPPPEVPAAPAEVRLSPETIQTLLSGMQPQAQPQLPEKQLTPEELDKLLNTFRPDEQLITELGLPPTSAKALERMIQGIVRNAVSMSYLTTEKVRRDLMKDIDPIRGYVTKSQERELRSQFFEANSDLKPYENLVEAIYAKMGQQGLRFPTTDAAFKAIGDQARQMLKSLNVTLEQGGANAGGGSVTPTNAPRRMPTLTGGGKGGAVQDGVEGSKVAKTMFG